jgi:hypothetical protein
MMSMGRLVQWVQTSSRCAQQHIALKCFAVLKGGVEPTHTLLVEQTRTQPKERDVVNQIAVRREPTLSEKIHSVPLSTCNETAHVLLAREARDGLF